MKILGLVSLLLLASALSSCRSKPEPQPTGEIWRATKGADGEMHMEFVRKLTPEEAAAGQPVESIMVEKKK